MTRAIPVTARPSIPACVSGRGRWRESAHTHFPITTKVPEVQAWFDQGNTLLHSFWFEEAERSFRWCLKLDPDCAMAYWGLARCGLNWFARGPLDTPELKRYLDFLNEASRRKAAVSERERLYIEAWEAAFTGDAFTLDGKERIQNPQPNNCSNSC